MEMNASSHYKRIFALWMFLGLLILAACGGGGGGGTEGEIPSVISETDGPTQIPDEGVSSPVSLTVRPEKATLTSKGSQTFSVDVVGATNTAVEWRVQEGEQGGTVNSDGTYTAPAAAGIYHLIATSQEDPSQAAVIEVTVVPEPVVSVAIDPPSMTMASRGKRKLTGSVSGTDNKALSWRIIEGSEGGSIDQEGNYTAPDAYGQYHLVATSQADPTKSATATVTVQLCNPPKRQPYLAYMTSTSAVIAWRCRPEGEVRWGSDSDLDNKVIDNKLKDQHFVVLSNLEPATTYSYEVRVEGEPLAQKATFKTAPSRDVSDFSFLAFADSGAGTTFQQNIAKLMKNLTFDFAIVPGDIIYETGADAEYDPHYFKPYAGMINHLPFFPALGNHDNLTEEGGPYRRNFYLPKGTFYHDFFWGDTHFIALDSNRLGDRKQQEWLISALKVPARWKIVFFHHPPFSYGTYGGYENIRQQWVPLFERYGVDLVMTGHSHSYERMVPINGVTYVVTGGGGAWLYPVGVGEFTAYSQSLHHVVSVQVNQNEISLQAIDETGKVFDQYSITKSVPIS